MPATEEPSKVFYRRADYSYVKKTSLAAALLILLVAGSRYPCYAEHKPKWKTVWKVTLAALAAANVADVHSSRGLWEANALLRDPAGRFNARNAILVKSVASGGVVLLEALLLRKNRERDHLYKPFAITNLAAAGIIAATAARNYTLPRARQSLR